MIFTLFLCILATVSGTPALAPEHMDKTRAAVVEFLKLENNFELKRDVELNEACSNHQITRQHFAEFLFKEFNDEQDGILPKLKSKSGADVKTITDISNDPDKYLPHFLFQLDKINKHWGDDSKISQEQRDDVLNYLSGFLKSDNEFRKTLVFRVLRILPGKEGEERGNGLYQDLRKKYKDDPSNGITKLFLEESNKGEPKVNPYLEFAFAVLKLSNFRYNEHVRNTKGETDDDYRDFLAIQKAVVYGETDDDLIVLLVKALETFNKTWKNCADAKAKPPSGPLTEYLEKEKGENDLYMRNYLKPLLTSGTLKDVDGELMSLLKNVLTK